MTRIKVFTIGLLLIFIDQFSKYLIRLNGGFSIICNKGIAFGIKLPSYIYWAVIIIMAVFVVIIILNYKFKINKLKNLKLIENLKFKIENYSQKYFIRNTLYIILVLSGAVGNLIDRLRFGCVIDFIDLKYWPIFNLADAFITVGVLGIIFQYFRKQNK